MPKQAKNQEEKSAEEDFEPADDPLSEDDAADGSDKQVIIDKNKLILIKRLLATITEASNQLRELLSGFITPEEEARISIAQAGDEAFRSVASETGEKIIEGVFDGEKMIGPDGKHYNVPANYASKSKLVEGDILKLTITGSGTFIYKQIGPIERTRVVGELRYLGDNEYIVTSDGKSWRVLPASVTYFKGQDGDETVILIPKAGESRWAAVENIIRK